MLSFDTPRHCFSGSILVQSSATMEDLAPKHDIQLRCSITPSKLAILGLKIGVAARMKWSGGKVNSTIWFLKNYLVLDMRYIAAFFWFFMRDEAGQVHEEHDIKEAEQVQGEAHDIT